MWQHGIIHTASDIQPKYIDRFWSKVDKNGDIPTHVKGLNKCWEWTGSKNHNNSGYGYFNIDGKVIGAHRVSWEIHSGKIPKGMWVLHKCDNPSCVNPDHLFLGTSKDNALDRIAKKRGIRKRNIQFPLNQNSLVAEDNLRRVAYRRGMKLIKYFADSKYFDEYGPYAVAELPMNNLVKWKLTLEEAREFLNTQPIKN